MRPPDAVGAEVRLVSVEEDVGRESLVADREVAAHVARGVAVGRVLVSDL